MNQIKLVAGDFAIGNVGVFGALNFLVLMFQQVKELPTVVDYSEVIYTIKETDPKAADIVLQKLAEKFTEVYKRNGYQDLAVRLTQNKLVVIDDSTMRLPDMDLE